ncbi:hypothetical protein ACOMHN_044053 [Nucella lapillus]
MLVHSVTLMNTSKQLNRALLRYHQHPRRWLNFGRPCLLALLFPPVEKWIQKSPSCVVVTVGMAVALPPVQLWATLPPVQMWVTLLPVQLWVTLPPTHLWVVLPPVQMWVTLPPAHLWVTLLPVRLRVDLPPAQLWVALLPVQLWVALLSVQLWMALLPVQLWMSLLPVQLFVALSPVQLWADKVTKSDTEDKIAGKEDTIAGKEDVIAGKEDVIAGKEDVIAGKDDVIAGKQDKIAGKKRVKFLDDCPMEPRVPVYLLVGGCVLMLKLMLSLWRAMQRRRHDSGDTTFDLEGDSEGAGFSSRTYRFMNVVLTLFLLGWHVAGSYWLFGIWKPRFSPLLHDPSQWCDRSVYMFAVGQNVALYCLTCLYLAVICCLAVTYRPPDPDIIR